MNQLQTETRGAFRWLRTIECDDAGGGVTIRTARAQLPSGLVVERVDTAGAPLVFVTDPGGCEIELSAEQAAELAAALGELPAPEEETAPGPP